MTSATEHAFTAGGTGAARPLKLALLFSILGEAVILLVWGFYLFPKGSWFNKTMWTLVYCGVGMGGAFGAVLVLGLLGRVDGWRAVGLTALLSTVMLGAVLQYPLSQARYDLRLFRCPGCGPSVHAQWHRHVRTGRRRPWLDDIYGSGQGLRA
ncbi:hypothetical protein [Sulfitobacter sp.]|uniref:hypothetical protein n=1 Tax=Sulfitobacter sp. TaxID=1903071 RepID=UPI0025DBF4C9|nr:hypothetical protein [Sulfitobacter sp.]